ncbi:MAG: YiiD C-terminal domain-containing protein [Actinobacteria bacterium]|nr:YiiD C-terminal domain-containing protein [Actinomycetota bacterium]MCB9412548.1 YiiD C-terminal domain-containing protein [Actinomycetota bacterium]
MENMPTQVPMVGTLNIEYLELNADHALLRMPDQPEYHNHIGGIHAGAMFTLAETASGAIVLAEFGDKFDRVVPLAVQATIRYLKVAMGPLTAEATMNATVDEVLADLESGTRPEFTVDVAIRDESGTQTGAMTIIWTLKRLKK